jgi:hypothetical protein
MLNQSHASPLWREKGEQLGRRGRRGGFTGEMEKDLYS